MTKLSPAEKVIKCAGGVSALADMLSLDRTAVWKWLRVRGDNSRVPDGSIPQKYWADILALSKKHDWNLHLEDLVSL